MEIKPGRFLATEAGAILTRIHDIVNTGPKSHQFLKLDTGMNDIVRISMFGAVHPIVVVNEAKNRLNMW